MYNAQEYKDQLHLDLKEGESWHIEFKDYDLDELSKKIEKWKDDLASEFASLASTGGRIYIGVTNTGTVRGVKGTHQAWQEKLFERAVGKVKPKVNWQSHFYTDDITGISLIRIDLVEGEPIYYVNNVPYIREGTRSRPAEPEEVKERFKNYFATREPILAPTKNNENEEQSLMVSWIVSYLIDLQITLSLYKEKEVNPQREKLKMDLMISREYLENNLHNVKKAFGVQSDYYSKLDAISGELLAANKVVFLIDGGMSWSEWIDHLENINYISKELLQTIETNVAITIPDLDQTEKEIREKTCRWLKSIDALALNTFIFEANNYVRQLLRLNILYSLTNKTDKAKLFKEIAEEMEKLSWARTNTDYHSILEALPKMQAKICE